MGAGERRGDAPFPEEEAAVAWQPALLACKSSHTRNAMQCNAQFGEMHSVALAEKDTEMLDIVRKSCTRDTALLAVLAGIMCKDCCCVENLVHIVWKTCYIHVV